MYDPLYEAIPAFERDSGVAVEIVAQLPHPELNEFVGRAFESGAGDLDLLSTHTKYAPSQANGSLRSTTCCARTTSRTCCRGAAELSRVGRRLLQVPRNLDVRLLHYRRDLFEVRPSAPRSKRATAGRCVCPRRGPSSPTSRSSSHVPG